MALTLRRFHGVKSLPAIGIMLRVATLLASLSCTSSTEPAGKGAIFTDEPSYSASLIPGTGEYAFAVVATFFNHSRDTVFLETCGPDAPHPEFGVVTPSGSSADGYNPAWACVAHDKQIAVAGGSSRVDTLTITGPVMWDGRTGQAIGALDGVFRLSYTVLNCRRDSSCILAPTQARSNTFNVKRTN
jgi:hypothetical protein